MRKINLYGAPSSGKSTLAAYQYAVLKIKGIRTEMVREYAKELVYSGKDISNLPQKDRLHILKTQIKREALFTNQVEILITDAPIFISAFYNQNEQALHLARKHRNNFTGQESNYFLTLNHMFEKNGARSHDEEQSKIIETQMQEFLLKENITFHILSASIEENLQKILKLEKL